jgi:hypothetical protein
MMKWDWERTASKFWLIIIRFVVDYPAMIRHHIAAGEIFGDVD